MIGKSFFGVILCALLGSCGAGGTKSENNTLVVSIEPLRYIVGGIVGDGFEISVMVPPGASPETWEPAPLQMRAAESAQLVFSTGLIGFETAMLARLPRQERYVDLSDGIELIYTAEDHDHDHESESEHGPGPAKIGGDGHRHGGVDPHIWMAPRQLARMARTAYDHIHEIWPDSVSYTVNYAALANRLETLDSLVSNRFEVALSGRRDGSASGREDSSARDDAGPGRAFMIFHPALTYYARDYGLRQIALESDGKEPSARQLAEIVATARAQGVTKVLYQNEFPRRTVEVVAAEIGAQPVEIDVVGYDVVDNILKITDIFTNWNYE
jgi:zinc transport system substrate-binding protein